MARLALGTVAVWTARPFGLGRTGWSIALGDAELVPRLAQAQMQEPVQALRVIMDCVSAYVLVRGKEIALVDTGLPNHGATFGEVITTAGLRWDAVGHVILTHSHPDHAGSMGEVLTAAPQARVYAGPEDSSQIASPRAMTPGKDGEEIFGLRIITTPGHPPVPISVFDPALRGLLGASDDVAAATEDS